MLMRNPYSRDQDLPLAAIDLADRRDGTNPADMRRCVAGHLLLILVVLLAILLRSISSA